MSNAVIDALEIENPYRYRCYRVGEKPLFNVQNDAVFEPDYGRVTDICLIGGNNGRYSICFEDGEELLVNSDTSGLIVHSHYYEENK